MLGVDHLLGSSDSSDEANSTDDDSNDLESNVFINHLRKCFISIDETSYCESVLLPDLRIFTNNHKNKNYDFNSILSKRIDANSYEHVDVNKIKNQHFSLDALNARLSGLKFDEKNKSLPGYKSENDKNEAYKFVPNDRPNKFDKNVVSLLSDQLNNKTNEANANSFFDYMRFEAHIQDPTQMQRIRIFLPMSGNTSMNVNIFKSAKVSDLIGLICCKYTLKNTQPPLKYDTVENYLLKIADETGDIEEEFPALEASNFVGKFGFTDLALIQKEQIQIKTDLKLPPPPIKVVIHFTDDSPDQTLEFESKNVTMLEIFEQVCEIKKGNIFCPSIRYRLEHVDEPGTLVDQNECLASFKKREFYFFRENSVRKSSLMPSNEGPSGPDLLLNQIKDVTQMSYDTSEFNVAYLSKWSKVQFKIGLSKDYIELEEIKLGHLGIGGKKVSNFYSIPMMNVVSCEVFKEGHKTHIRIVIKEDGEDEVSSYKHLDFECESETAIAIRSKCFNLMSFLNSALVHNFNPDLHKTSKWSRKLYQSNRKSSRMIK